MIEMTGILLKQDYTTRNGIKSKAAINVYIWFTL